MNLSPAAPSKWLWLDLEMTGLDTAVNTIMEIGLIVTDSTPSLTPLRDHHRIIKTSQDQLDGMDEWCTNTHSESGNLIYLTRCVGARSSIDAKCSFIIYSQGCPKRVLRAAIRSTLWMANWWRLSKLLTLKKAKESYVEIPFMRIADL